jgi:CheY-like chemotaxis protein
MLMNGCLVLILWSNVNNITFSKICSSFYAWALKIRLINLQHNKTYHVVIVDDSEIDLELLAHVVSDLPNINVYKFQQGVDAIAFLSSNSKIKIDLFLCDYEMPKFNGLDILIKVRKKNISVPFLFISAHVSVELANLCKSEGATGFIVKPYITNQLLTKIEKAINYQYSLQA